MGISKELQDVMDAIERLKPKWKAFFFTNSYTGPLEHNIHFKNDGNTIATPLDAEPLGHNIYFENETNEGLVIVKIWTHIDVPYDIDRMQGDFRDVIFSNSAKIDVYMHPWEDYKKKKISNILPKFTIFDQTYLVRYTLKSLFFGIGKFFQQLDPIPSEFLYLRDYVNKIFEPLFCAELAKRKEEQEEKIRTRQSLEQKCIDSFFKGGDRD
ncbi:MAG: hypothetical protein AAB461_00910 [Patescibacteria group bacterium]